MIRAKTVASSLIVLQSVHDAIPRNPTVLALNSGWATFHRRLPVCKAGHTYTHLTLSERSGNQTVLLATSMILLTTAR